VNKTTGMIMKFSFGIEYGALQTLLQSHLKLSNVLTGNAKHFLKILAGFHSTWKPARSGRTHSSTLNAYSSFFPSFTSKRAWFLRLKQGIHLL
jgi:hypothetical protein